MLCAVDGDEDLHVLMREASIRSCVIVGEVWVAVQGGLDYHDADLSEGSERVVGVAAWLPPSAEYHPK